MQTLKSSNGVRHIETRGRIHLSDDILSRFYSAVPVKGLTHRFYRYPARFSPEFVRQIILQFSRPGDLICDPFMGGGTSIVEAIASGRKAFGVDINSLSEFITSVKTTPLSFSDKTAIIRWLDHLKEQIKQSDIKIKDPTITSHVSTFIGTALQELKGIKFPRQEQFLRCAILRTGQWASERGMQWPSHKEVWNFFQNRIFEMFKELEDIVATCRQAGIYKNQITKQRILLSRSAIGLEKEQCLRNLKGVGGIGNDANLGRGGAGRGF